MLMSTARNFCFHLKKVVDHRLLGEGISQVAPTCKQAHHTRCLTIDRKQVHKESRAAQVQPFVVKFLYKPIQGTITTRTTTTTNCQIFLAYETSKALLHE